MPSPFDINRQDVVKQPGHIAGNPNDRNEKNLSDVAGNVISNVYRGHNYVIISDNHLISDRNLDFAIEISKRTGKPLALEVLNPAVQPFLDAFSAGIITREEVMAYSEDIKIFPEGSIPPIGSPQYYMGIKRGGEFYNKLLDAIEQGVKVFGVGTAKTGNSYVTDQEEEALQATCSLLVRMRLETLISMKKAGREISAGSLEAETKFHPDYKQFLSNTKKLEAWVAKLKDPNWEGNTSFDIGKRVSGDKAVSEMLAQIRTKNPSGAVILYGTQHTIHNNNGGDIDGHLRAQGQSVLILDPINKNWVQHCESTLMFLSEENCVSKITELEDSMHQKARIFGDPDRFSIDFAGNTIQTTNEQSDWGRRIMSLLVP